MTTTVAAPGPLPPLARPDVRRDRRPGGGRRDAPQRGPDRTGSATRSSSSGRAAPARRRSRGSSPRRVNCTNLQDGDPCDALPVVRRRSARARALDLVEIDAAIEPRDRRHPRAPRAAATTPRPSSGARSTSSTRPTRSRRTPGTPCSSRSRSRPTSSSSCSPRPSRQDFPPAILSRLQRFDVRRLTVAEIEGKLGRILAADGREADAGGRPPHRPARRRRDARRRVDARPAPRRRRRADRRGARPRPARPGRRARPSTASSTASSAATPPPASPLLDALDERGRDLRALLDQVVEAIRAELVAGLADRRRAGTIPAALAAVGRRLAAHRPEPGRASAASASSSSSPSSAPRRRRPSTAARRGRAPRGPARATGRRRPAQRRHRRPRPAAGGRRAAGRPRRRRGADAAAAEPTPRRPTAGPRRRRAAAQRRRRRPRAAAPPQPRRPRAARSRAVATAAGPVRVRPPTAASPALDELLAAVAGDRRPPQRPPADQAAHRRPAGRSPSTATS